MKKILIVDDEERMRKLLSNFLIKQGFVIIEAENGKEALELFYRDPSINLIILDVMMPECDGWTVCREIRKKSQIPIIMLTARNEESDQLFGFDLGADEYISKPFSLNILYARIQVLFRRADVQPKSAIDMQGLVVDEAKHTVSVDGKVIDLSPKEFELLLYLINNQGNALNRDQLLTNVWGYDFFGDTRTIDSHVKNLRQKLGSKGEFIQTVRGLGYRFEVIK